MPGEFFKISVAAHSLGNWSKIVWVLRFAICDFKYRSR